MGPVQSSNPIKYTQSIDDDHFGRIDIFQQKQNPAQYIMKYGTLYQTQQQVKRAYQFNLRLQKLKHRVLSKLYYIETEEVKYCLKRYMLYCYYSFYNITLYQIFTKRVENESLFPQNQLWYILRSLIELGDYLQSESIAIQDYNLKKIFITPGGFAKLYLTQIQQNQQHSNLNKCLIFTKHSSLLAPEQVELLNKNKYKHQYNVYKADVFSIGIMILQLMTLDEGTYYNYHTLSIDTKKIQYIISELAGTYSNYLIDFVKKLLEQDPNNRYDFKEATAKLEYYKNHNIDITKSIGADISLKRKSQTILSTINFSEFNSKLVAAPINSMVFKKRPSKLINLRENEDKEN